MTKFALPREGELFDGKYRIGPVLGMGGMAAVIAAKHLGFDQMVALKVLLPEFCDDPDVVERFVQEGKTAIKVRSEHVVRMLDVGVVSGRAYLVMEYLDGSDLAALLQTDGPFPFVTAIDLLLQACEAIGEAHALGIVHRDLKPANLFLTHRADGSACLKVLDFGISKMPRSALAAQRSSSLPTLATMVMGSPHYMSPEQMTSTASADQRADIWSLGAILYELLTGQLAFGGSTSSEVCARVFQGAPVLMAQLRSDIPGDVALIVSRCLERDLLRRYGNISDLARALAPFGSAHARASAASIARVVEGGLEGPPLEAGTLKATAAQILAPAPVRRRRTSGYLVGALVAVAAMGAIAGRILRVGPHLPWPIALGAPAVPGPGLSPPLSAPNQTTPAPSPALATAVPAVPPTHRALPGKPHHASDPRAASPAGSRTTVLADAGAGGVF